MSGMAIAKQLGAASVKRSGEHAARAAAETSDGWSLGVAQQSLDLTPAPQRWLDGPIGRFTDTAEVPVVASLGGFYRDDAQRALADYGIRVETLGQNGAREAVGFSARYIPMLGFSSVDDAIKASYILDIPLALFEPDPRWLGGVSSQAEKKTVFALRPKFPDSNGIGPAESLRLRPLTGDGQAARLTDVHPEMIALADGGSFFPLEEGGTLLVRSLSGARR